ncbi:MAG: hypothetical protein J0J02_02020 [Thiobacillus sp.]|nr:hypothetical protein [Thiobacillus sp.]
MNIRHSRISSKYVIRGLCAINGMQLFYYANGKIRRETVQLNERGLSRNVARVGLISYLA